jgi:hypothetical protein
MDQSVKRMARRRMDYQPSGLVDDSQIFIIVHDIKRDILANKSISRLWLCYVKNYFLTRYDFMVSFADGLAIDLDAA